MEFLVHCTHHVLKEDDVTELRTYDSLCYVILLLGMHLCVSSSNGKLKDKKEDTSPSAYMYELCL